MHNIIFQCGTNDDRTYHYDQCPGTRKTKSDSRTNRSLELVNVLIDTTRFTLIRNKNGFTVGRDDRKRKTEIGKGL